MARKKYSASRRTALLGLFTRRTESIAHFAKTHGVSAATLYKWQQAYTMPETLPELRLPYEKEYVVARGMYGQGKRFGEKSVYCLYLLARKPIYN